MRMASPQVIDASFKRVCLLSKIRDDVICPVMRQILTWVTPDWDQKSNFIDYLKSKNVSQNILKKNIFSHQIDAIKMHPGGKEWDTTLIYSLLRLCGGLADKDDVAWASGSGKEPECIITRLKDIRNNLAHKITELSKKDFLNKTEEIRGIIQDLFESMDKMFPQLKMEIDTNMKKYHNIINDIRDATFAPENLEAFKKESYFPELTEFVRKEGVPELIKHLDRITSFNPLSLIVKEKGEPISVSDVFTGMQLEEDKNRKEVLLENIIDIASNTSPGGLLLLKGHAGIGKTTILKKITSDWVKKTGTIKRLDSYDLLLYAEFRDRVESFQELIENFLGDVHMCFNNKDLVKVVLGLRNLVILDGFDEINSKSSLLFQDILFLIKNYKNLTVVITTRPEAEEKLARQLSIDKINVVHVWLIGIETRRRADFVSKYFDILTQNNPPSQGLDGLLEYLKKTQHRMSEVWKLPYNLSLVTILWILMPEVVNRITTEAELYWQMLHLSKSKLKDRLQRSESTSSLRESVLEHKTEQFLEKLSWQSLLGLKNDDIYLPETAYQQIKDFCLKLEVPIEELAGAFLKKVTTSKDSRYSFPHKGNQEFMGAYNIYIKVKKSKQRQKGKVKDIFRKLYDGSPPASLAKYQNLLIQTLSVFHVCEVRVTRDTKKEVLNLLEESGLSDKDSWLKVLHNLKCDEFTAKWIVERHKLLQQKICITDFSFDAYSALFKAIDTPPASKDIINININLDQTPTGMDELENRLSKLQFNVKEIILMDLFKGVPSSATSSQEAIPLLLKNCKKYVGVWQSSFQITPTLKFLFVRLPNLKTMNDFLADMPTVTGLEELRICISVNIGRTLHPIPKSTQGVSMYITDVTTKEDAEKVQDILLGLRPEDEDRSYPCLSFPRCSLNVEGIHHLVESLKGVTVTSWILLPEKIQPDEATCKEISEKATALTQSLHGVLWDNETSIFRV